MKIIIKITLCFLLSISINLSAQRVKDNYAGSSLLSSGKWFKIAVTGDGVYRLDYSKLRQLGLSNPSFPRIFGNNWGQLSYYNNDPKPDDLQELPISISGNDKVLDDGEYILFYGKGTGKWNFNSSTGDYDYIKHNYSDTAFYFLTSGDSPGKIMSSATGPAGQENYFSSVSDALFHYEHDVENLIKSGREWYQPISSSSGITIDPGFDNVLSSEKMKCTFRVVARASVPTIFRLNEGESVKKSIQIPGVNLYDFTGAYALTGSDTAMTTPASSSPVYKIMFYNNGEAGAKGWIDWVKLQGRRTTSYTGNAMLFSDSKSVAPGRITKFSMNSSVSDIILWEVSDQFKTRQTGYLQNGNNITFKAVTDSLKTFFAFTSANVTIPFVKPAPVPVQDLHSSPSCDMVIITHPVFRKYAEKVAAIHSGYNGLISQIVTPEQIYNEFSGGIPDIAAIRNFVRMKYMKQKGTAHPLKYLLLFGDGSYENKTPPPHNPNFIPTYQSENSTVYVSSFTSDDFYTLLGDGAGEADGVECVGVGRFPVSDTIQAGIMVDKVASYLGSANNGDWKNVICLTADDEDANTHMIDAEGLASALKQNNPSFNVSKIYLDSYKQTTSVNGQTYPAAEKAINDRISAGCLIFNYTGHGSENGLAAERVVKPEDITAWNNIDKLPLFITATCEFSRFDDVETNVLTGEMTGKTSAGEMVLLNKNGGGIALMSTTRIVYSAPNFILNRNIFNSAFLRDSTGNSMCLGDIIKNAKILSGPGINKRNFTLLGDPAVKLEYPWHGTVVTDSVNNSSVKEGIDSLKALSKVTIAGHIEDQQGGTLNSFNGTVEPLVFDKAEKVKTLANDGGPVMEFEVRNNILFSGKTIVKDGKFRFSFIVPRDINYSFGNGKISYYANNNSEDMNGSFTGLIVGGFSNIALNDTTGPVIKLYMNDTLFKSGGITDQNPKLLAIIEDSGGINTTGSGIGHDLTAFLDNDHNSSFVLNSYFENDFDNFARGRIDYDFSTLSTGSHTLTLKAWDNSNNSSEKSILFLVETGGKFLLKNLLNYPNPFANGTTITAEHNSSDEELAVSINIYSSDGRLIKYIRKKVYSPGYVLPPVEWDGNDDMGRRVGRGVYPYSVTVMRNDGKSATASGRMIIL